MAEFKHLNLAQLAEFARSNDKVFANNYISKHIAVARCLIPDFIKKAHSFNETIVLNEIRILVIKKGWTNPVINLTEKHYEAGDLVFVSTNGLFQLKNVSEDIEGFALSISNDLFNIAFGNRIPKTFDGRLRDFCIRLKHNELEFLDNIHYLLYLNSKEENSNPQVSLSLISAYLWYIDNLMDINNHNKQQNIPREQKLFRDFMQLVADYTPLERNIDFYASKLCISPRYMGVLVKKASGKTAKEWIDDAVITKIKIEIRHTDKSINKISDDMNFPNPSFFSRYFKNSTKLTPLQYRNKHINTTK